MHGKLWKQRILKGARTFTGISALGFPFKDGEEEIVIEPEDEGTWRLVDIFGDQKIVKGKIKIMKLVDHKIIFEGQPV